MNPGLFPINVMCEIIKYLDWSEAKKLAECCKSFAAFLEAAKIVLPFNAKITATAFEHFRGIRVLNISKCGYISNAALGAIYGEAADILEKLNAAFCEFDVGAIKYLCRTRVLILKGAICPDIITKRPRFPADMMKIVAEIDLSYTEVRDSFLKYLSHVKKISLKECGDRVSGAALKHLGGVRSLNIAGCYKVKDADIAPLKNITELKAAFTQITTAALLPICCNMTALNISLTRKISADVLYHLKNIKELNVATMKGIEPRHLCGLSHLKKISLNCCPGITDEHLKHLAEVREIDLGSCDEITDRGLSYLTAVEIIVLTRCDNITDAGLLYLHNARAVSLGFQYNITDSGLSALTRVTKLYLQRNTAIRGECFKHLKNLRDVSLINYAGTLEHFAELDRIYLLLGTRIEKLEYLKNVRHIKIVGDDFIKDADIAKLENVERLKLINCSALCGKFLRSTKNLRHLRLINCFEINTALIEKYAGRRAAIRRSSNFDNITIAFL